MTTIKELKEKKEVQVTRVDNNFIDNSDIINNFEEQAKQNNYEVVEKKLNSDYMEYVLNNPNEVNTIKYYVGSDNELISRLLSEQTQPVIKHEVKEDFLYITVKGRSVYFNLRLNASYMKKQLQGKLVFRSKDYYFEFIDEDNKKQQFFSSHDLKANMLQDNKIILKEYGLEYILK